MSARFKSGVYFTPREASQDERPRSSQPSHFPLLSVSIDAILESNISTTTITQKYTNPSSSSAEHTKYLFPIYDGSAVIAFKCWIGKDKLLEGAVKPKQQARREFAEAVSKHKAAALVEELTPEIFETNLGNIPSQAGLTVQITLATQLKIDQTTGATTLTIPTSVAPRYGRQPEGYTQPDTSQDAVAGQDALQVNVDLFMPEGVKKVESQTHMISVDLGSQTGVSDIDRRTARASLAGRFAALEKDLVLTVLPNSNDLKASRAIAVPQPDSKKSTIALSLNPGDLFRKRFNPEDFTGEVIFIADRSGSMMDKMSALRDVMNVFVRSLPEHCSFNIVSFGTRFSWLWPTSQPYSEASLEDADRHITSFAANYGRTEILSAMESIPMHFNKDADVPTNVIVLTDGETYDVERVIKFVRKMISTPENNIRFFALGIGDQVSHRLVNGIGLQGGGCAEVISNTRSSLVWQGRVIQMLKNALTPSRLRCSISFAGMMQNGTDGVQAPHSIPPMNGFSQYSVYYMLDSGVEELPGTLTITAATEDGMKLTTELPIHRSNTHSLHHLAAKAFMNDYETGQSWLHAKHASLKADDEDAFNRILEHEAQQLGAKWSIPSRWTSYVAVDRDTQIDHDVSLEAAERGELSAASDSDSESDDDMGFGLYDTVAPPRVSGPGATRFLRAASSSSDDDAEPAAKPIPYVAPNRRTGGASSAARGAQTVFGCFGAPGGSARGSFRGLPSSQARFSAANGIIHRARKMKKLAPNVSEGENTDKETTQHELTLSKILHSQAANGDMRVEGSDIEGPILGCYQLAVMEDMRNALASSSVVIGTKERAFLLNVLAIVYVTVKCAESKELWEMQIAKARRYFKKQLENEAGVDSDRTMEKIENMAERMLVSN